LTNGKTRPRDQPAKRSIDDDIDISELVADEGNSTRKTTPIELWEHHGLLKCASRDCGNEKKFLESMVSGLETEPSEDICAEGVLTTGATIATILIGSQPTTAHVARTVNTVLPTPTKGLPGSQNAKHRYNHRHRGPIENLD